MEFGSDNIRVNSICPGSVNGERIENVIRQEATDRNISEDAVRQAYLNQVSMQSFIDAEEIVGMIDYVLSPVAKKVAGQIIAIDGHTEGLSQIRIEKDGNIEENLCPTCKNKLVLIEGCSICIECGYSGCTSG